MVTFMPRHVKSSLQRLLICVQLLVAGSLWAQHTHAPQRPPRVQLASGAAFAPDGSLWLVGLNHAGQLFVQSAPGDDLRRWGSPRLIATGGDTVAADGESRPKIAFGDRGQVVISYTHPLAKPYTGMIRMLRSNDAGLTFSLPSTVHADRQEITHRFDSIAFDAQGVLHTLWVDKRDMEIAPKVGRKSSYRGAAIYRNESRDGGATFGPDIKLADHSCECCRIALTTGQDGALRALWRHVFEPNERDHGFAALLPGGQTPVVRATMDRWAVDACPHHGPGLAAAETEGFHAVWFGVQKKEGADVGAVRYARLNHDGSLKQETVQELPDERAEHADVVASGPRVAIVWRSTEGARSVLKAWLSTDGGRSFRLLALSSVTGETDQPRLIQAGEQMVVVWRNRQEVQVHDIRF
jgi:hypothetical protein